MAGPNPIFCPTFPEEFWKRYGRRCAARRYLCVPRSGRNWRCWSMNMPTGIRSDLAAVWASRADRFIAGGNAGQREISHWRMSQVAAARPIFPPRDHALVKALACERVAQTGEPISRQSLADLTSRAQAMLGKSISRSTVWRILDKDAIKPWQYEYWIFPRDPQFLEKAGPILDLYAGHGHGKPLENTDCIVSADEKTSIQARIRIHSSLEPGRHGSRANTSAAVRCSIWRPGMCAVDMSWGVENQRRESNRL
jgi:hypothetical protein